jgi:hypothetical protein
MKSNLRIICARHYTEVTARAFGHELIAVEARQLDQRLGALSGETLAIYAVLRKESRAKAERDGQTYRRRVERFT